MPEEEQDASEESQPNPWVDKRIQTTENLEQKEAKTEDQNQE